MSNNPNPLSLHPAMTANEIAAWCEANLCTVVISMGYTDKGERKVWIDAYPLEMDSAQPLLQRQAW